VESPTAAALASVATAAVPAVIISICDPVNLSGPDSFPITGSANAIEEVKTPREKQEVIKVTFIFIFIIFYSL
jgi:hypothetical protein